MQRDARRMAAPESLHHHPVREHKPKREGARVSRSTCRGKTEPVLNGRARQPGLTDARQWAGTEGYDTKPAHRCHEASNMHGGGNNRNAPTDRTKSQRQVARRSDRNKTTTTANHHPAPPEAAARRDRTKTGQDDHEASRQPKGGGSAGEGGGKKGGERHRQDRKSVV